MEQIEFSADIECDRFREGVHVASSEGFHTERGSRFMEFSVPRLLRGIISSAAEKCEKKIFKQ